MTHSLSASILRSLVGLSRRQKKVVQVLADALLVAGSFMLVIVLRTETLEFLRDPAVWGLAIAMVGIALSIFTAMGLYSRVIRYISLEGAGPILAGNAAAAAFLCALLLTVGAHVPRSVPVSFLLFSCTAVTGARLTVRLLVSRSMRRNKERVLIYGAGEAGRQLLNVLRQGRTHEPVAFVDDAAVLRRMRISGCPVHQPGDLPMLIERHSLRTVLLAVPSATAAERKAILRRLEPLPVHVQTVPGIADLVSGRAKVSQVRDVPIEDLLGRSPVPPDPALLATNIRGKVVMVTGAAGSIGSELCRQILRQRPAALVLYEISEVGLYQIDMELRERAAELESPVRIVPLLGSVGDRPRVDAALRNFGVQTIYHAAAYKHVPLVEENVVQGIRNNVFGTETLARAAAGAGVEIFVLISTDKAVRPTNVMGATKRLAELVCQREAAQGSATRFSMVRFGNVLGSSGSVIPRFRAQIAAGGPITVTHPDITRYFMTIPEAAQLVIQAGAMADAGEVLVLDMGEPVRIVDLAARMIRLSGLTPHIAEPEAAAAPADSDGDQISIVFTGLRHGEKLYEELLIDAETRPTGHPLIQSASEAAMPSADLAALLRSLYSACERSDLEGVRALLQRAPLGYRPTGAIADLVWRELPPQQAERMHGPAGQIAA
ncbi:polysaccharide biosynthesis protein [Sphingomonas sp. CJ20]